LRVHGCLCWLVISFLREQSHRNSTGLLERPMSVSFPCFRSDFLNRICEGFRARSKPLSQSGSLTHSSDLTDSYEWIVIYYRPRIGPYVILQVIENQQINLFLRSSRRHNRGKILLAMENVRVVDNATSFVKSFERTLDLIHGFYAGNPDPQLAELIRLEWDKVAVKLSESEKTKVSGTNGTSLRHDA